MRLVVALGLLVISYASANAATQRPVHHRARQHDVAPSQGAQGVIVPNHGAVIPGFAVPGWSDEATRRWLDDATPKVTD